MVLTSIQYDQLAANSELHDGLIVYVKDAIIDSLGNLSNIKHDHLTVTVGPAGVSGPGGAGGRLLAAAGAGGVLVRSIISPPCDAVNLQQSIASSSGGVADAVLAKLQAMDGLEAAMNSTLNLTASIQSVEEAPVCEVIGTIVAEAILAVTAAPTTAPQSTSTTDYPGVYGMNGAEVSGASALPIIICAVVLSLIVCGGMAVAVRCKHLKEQMEAELEEWGDPEAPRLTPEQKRVMKVLAMIEQIDDKNQMICALIDHIDDDSDLSAIIGAAQTKKRKKKEAEAEAVMSGGVQMVNSREKFMPDKLSTGEKPRLFRRDSQHFGPRGAALHDDESPGALKVVTIQVSPSATKQGSKDWSETLGEKECMSCGGKGCGLCGGSGKTSVSVDEKADSHELSTSLGAETRADTDVSTSEEHPASPDDKSMPGSPDDKSKPGSPAVPSVVVSGPGPPAWAQKAVAKTKKPMQSGTTGASFNPTSQDRCTFRCPHCSQILWQDSLMGKSVIVEASSNQARQSVIAPSRQSVLARQSVFARQSVITDPASDRAESQLSRGGVGTPPRSNPMLDASK